MRSGDGEAEERENTCLWDFGGFFCVGNGYA